MIEDSYKLQKRKFRILLLIFIIAAVLMFLISLMVGNYGFISPADLVKIVLNEFGMNYDLPNSYANIVGRLRLPGSLAAFLVGGALSVSGMVYQNTFNNKLISPDILGVSAGACVGAGIAILLGLNGAMVSTFAFGFGILSVVIALVLPKLFRNKATITLVLSGIIVGAFMNSIIGLIKYLADQDEKLAAITFWIMGSVTGAKMKDILWVLPFVIIPTVILLLMSDRIDVISLGNEEATLSGLNYRRNRLIVIACSTLLTAASVSISGNVGWVGLVIPHMSRTMIGNRSRESMPIAFLFGGTFMVIVEVLSRTLAKEDVPLSIITGILGAIIYSIVLIKNGRDIND